MKLNVKAIAFASATLWSLAVFLTGLANLIWPTYGQGFLQLVASIYPGYDATPNLLQVIVGTLYGIADGAIGGALFAWLYNWCVATQLKQAS